MQRNFVEVQDVLESAKKYGKENVLYWNPLKINDNETNAKKGNSKSNAKANPCTWIPIGFTYANGKTTDYIKLKFKGVLLGSGAKVPSTVKEGEKIKNLNIAFRKFDIEEILAGDYAPKQKETEEAQELENTKAAKNAEALKKATDDFNDAMEILDLSYQKICNEMANAESLSFTFRKDRKMKKNEDLQVFNSECQIFSIRQLTREDKETKEDIELSKPFTRVKLMVGKETDQIGIDTRNKETNTWKFTPNVFDSKKITKKNGYEPVLAKVKSGGKSCILDVVSAPKFITYKSIVGGVIEFKDIVSSKFGISFGNRFLELYVARHKSGGAEPAFSKEDLKSFRNNIDSDEEEDDDEVDLDAEEEEPSSKQKSKPSKKNKQESDNENTDLEDYEEEVEEVEVDEDGDEDLEDE